MIKEEFDKKSNTKPGRDWLNYTIGSFVLLGIASAPIYMQQIDDSKKAMLVLINAVASVGTGWASSTVINIFRDAHESYLKDKMNGPITPSTRSRL